MNAKVYKCCAVPQCNNTSIKTPNKLFVHVPHNKTTRNKWLKLARRDTTAVLPNTHLYFCEDHFDMPNDMANYMEYYLMGSVSIIRMKPGCIPTRYQCQPDRRKRTSDATERPYIAKKQRQTLIEDCEKYFKDKTLATKQVEHGETSSGRSDSDSSTRTQPEPSEPIRGQQCRFCGDFKECSPVVQKPYFMGNKTTLALNHLRVELDFSIDSLPKSVCRDCDTKLLETFEFIKQVNTAQFSLVTMFPKNATNANSSAKNPNNDFQHIEIDTQIVKAEFESMDEDSRESKVEIRKDSLTLGETVFLTETHKRKYEVGDKKLKKVKKEKSVKIQNTELIIDIKEEMVDNDDGNREDSVDFSDTGTDVKPSELELAFDYQKDIHVKGKKTSSGECND